MLIALVIQQRTLTLVALVSEAESVPAIEGGAGSYMEPSRGLEVLTKNHEASQAESSLIW